MEKNVKVHCLTNPVTMQSVANVLLAAGGSAVMAQDEQKWKRSRRSVRPLY